MSDYLKDNAQTIANLIAIVAFLISILALRESKRQHIETHRAKLIFHVLQQEQVLYLLVQNIGEMTAVDIAVNFHGTFENPAQKLHILSPGITYRYVLMNIAQIEAYSEQFLQLSVQYRDTSSSSIVWNETYKFDLLEILKYTCNWNEDQHCFDILPL